MRLDASEVSLVALLSAYSLASEGQLQSMFGQTEIWTEKLIIRA